MGQVGVGLGMNRRQPGPGRLGAGWIRDEEEEAPARRERSWARS